MNHQPGHRPTNQTGVYIMKCEICNINESIGTITNMMGRSCSACQNCIEKAVQPEVVFEEWYKIIGLNFEVMYPGYADQVVVSKNGKYVSYKEWARLKHDKDRL
jgi:hypothetical protein